MQEYYGLFQPLTVKQIISPILKWQIGLFSIYLIISWIMKMVEFTGVLIIRGFRLTAKSRFTHWHLRYTDLQSITRQQELNQQSNLVLNFLNQLSNIVMMMRMRDI